MKQFSSCVPFFRSAWLAVVGGIVLAGCSVAPPGVEINDPYEARNRAVHEANVRLDRLFFDEAPEADLTEAARGNPMGNLAANLRLPREVLNNLLQFRPDHAVENTLRFAINSTLGIGGLFDPAGELGLHGHGGDFGQTLHVWGVPEGAYLVHPVLGPSTERDTVGMVVDFLVDPLRIALPLPEYAGVFAIRALGYMGARAQNAELVEFTLHQSADSYSQMRLMYLQNRRFQIGDESQVEYFDPYDELF